MKKKIANWLIQRQTHIIVWTVFILYETLVIGLIFNVFGNPITYVAHYIIIIAFFYANGDYFLGWSFEEKEQIWWRLPGIVIVGLSLYVILHYFADLFLMSVGVIKAELKYPFNYQFILKNIYRGIYFFGFSIGYYVLKTREIDRKEKEWIKELHYDDLLKRQETERQLQETQNAFLKAQINPHFLFNTLDFVYHMVHSNPNAAADAIVHLSRIMRFAIDSDKNGPFVLVEDEISYIKTLVSLLELRKSGENFPLIECSQEAKRHKIIPLVILTLAENMLKHGDFSCPENSSHFKVYIDDRYLFLETKNKAHKREVLNSNHTGLENIKNRLSHAYGHSAEMVYQYDKSGHFVITVKIIRQVPDYSI